MPHGHGPLSTLLAGLFASMLAGCAGQVTYVEPKLPAKVGLNEKLVAKPREQVWAEAIPQLGKRFFSINTIDKASGLVNVSYSGDPERYVDCGTITSYVKNARGERTYEFPAARAATRYEVMESSGLYFIDRTMTLEGRINLIFQEETPSTTRVTATTRYVLTRKQTVRNFEGRQNFFTESLALNTNSQGTIGGGNTGIICVPTGQLEAEVLEAVQ